MINETDIYNFPAIGCMLGHANQILLGELDKALKKAVPGITTNEYLVLRALYYSDGIQQCEIAALVGRDKAGICRCVSALARKGLVSTEPVSHKCVRVYLTDKALEIKPGVMAVAAERHQALVDLVSAEDLAVFNNVLEKIITNKSK